MALSNAITGEVILSGDGTEGTFGTADCTSGCSDPGACNFDGSDLNDGSCDYSCIGCTDSAAANYDPNATIDSGNCVYCDPGTFILTVDMFDSFGDGWSGAEYYLFDINSGALVDSGSLGTAFSGDGLTVGTDLICLAPGCYSFQTTTDTWPDEVSISLSDQFGTQYGTVGTDAELRHRLHAHWPVWLRRLHRSCGQQLQPICQHRRRFLSVASCKRRRGQR